MDTAVDHALAPETEQSPAFGEITRLAWTPSFNEMAAYRAREIDMCVLEIQRGVTTAQANSLFSQQTWDAALARLGGVMPVIAPHIVKSIEKMREFAQENASNRVKFGRNGFAHRK